MATIQNQITNDEVVTVVHNELKRYGLAQTEVLTDPGGSKFCQIRETDGYKYIGQPRDPNEPQAMVAK